MTKLLMFYLVSSPFISIMIYTLLRVLNVSEVIEIILMLIFASIHTLIVLYSGISEYNHGFEDAKSIYKRDLPEVIEWEEEF